MYGYVYLTTNLINNRKYIGQKKSSYFLKEEYLGSGKILCQAVEKYGKENFKVELIEECSSKEELDEREKYWIEKFNAVYSDEYYNLAFGGNSPAHKLSDKEKARVSRQMRELQKNGGFMKGKHHSKATKKKMSKVHIGTKMTYSDKDAWRSSVGRDMHDENNPMFGKKHSEESKKKMSEARTLHNKGKVWMTNETIDRFVSVDMIPELEAEGYRLGRRYFKRNRESSTTIESVSSKKDTTE